MSLLFERARSFEIAQFEDAIRTDPDDVTDNANVFETFVDPAAVIAFGLARPSFERHRRQARR
jgi:hypothetical protein